MLDIELLQLLPHILSLLVVVACGGAAILESLGMVRYTGVVAGREDDTKAELYGEEYSMVYRRLRQLGFVPLGLIKARLLPRYEPVTKIVFGHPLEHCFASVFQLSPRDPLRVDYSSSYSRGGYVLTAGYTTVPLTSEHCLISGAETRDVEKLYHRHTRAQETFKKQSQEPLPAESLADYLTQERRVHHDNPAILALIRADGQAHLLMFVTSLLIGFAVMMFTDDQLRWQLSVGGALGCALYIGRRQMNRYASQLSRRINLQEQEEAEDDLWL